MAKKFRFEEFGFEVEIGKVARQADGAVWFKKGNTMLLATATKSQMEDFPGFFPLFIDYREQFAAVGKIPGGYTKREGRLSDREILTSRLIDRALRPLFPSHYFDQVQILATAYSVDKAHEPNTISLLASSLALVISDIPFLEPVAAVEVARVDGDWVFNPTYPESQTSDVRLVVAGTHEGICMVEGSANELLESEFVDVLFKAHDKIKKLVVWQKDIQKELGKEKSALVDHYEWGLWENAIENFLTDDHTQSLFVEDKLQLEKNLASMKIEFNQLHKEKIETQNIPQGVLDYLFDSVLTQKLTDLICSKKTRFDGRGFRDVRNISVEVGLLPSAHGSSLFTRGSTQALVSATLGSGQDEQRFDNIMTDEEDRRNFMLHYNFLPFSTGEVRPMRGAGRREIGHGYLANSAFDYMRPSKEEFPYTIRVVSDILESNGSSSMATACGTTMALMQAGVPLKKMVGGVAMGLLQSSDGSFVTLTDITGKEDAFGLMDFKVLGTNEGITAIQMDIKYKGGLSREIFESALSQARDGRIFILNEMSKVMDKPNEKISDLVPKVIQIKIDKDKIGAVIGSGGKTIREIIEVTKTSIDIESDGIVKIFGGPDSDIDRAINWVKTLSGQIEIGDTFDGIVRRITDFGMFVELVPGQDGLVHISTIPREKQKSLSQDYKEGDNLSVIVSRYDEVTGKIGLKIIISKKS